MGSKQLSLWCQPTVVAQQLLLVMHELRDLDYMGEREEVLCMSVMCFKVTMYDVEACK